MDSFGKVKAKIQEYSQSISEEIAQMRLYDVAEIQQKTQVRMVMALMDCLEIQITYYLEEKNQILKHYYQKGLNHQYKQQLTERITELNKKKIEANRLYSNLNDLNEYRLLRAFLVENLGEEKVQEFYNMTKKTPIRSS